MKSTEAFKNTIKAYLDNRAKNDALFAAAYAKENKNIDDCITHIINTVKQSGCNGFADEEIYSMAVHYYDEDNIKIGKPLKYDVVVNHGIELTEAEKEQARKDAIVAYSERVIAEMKQKKEKKAASKSITTVEQPGLFD